MKVESFELDHTKVGAPYVRLAKTWDINGQIINKFDLRFLQPNQDEMTFQELHTIEHLLATYLRDKLDNIIDVAPYGCATGYGLIGYGFTIEELRDALEETLLDILNMTEVPADNPVQCGNYKTLDIIAAKVFVQSLLPLQFKIQETITYNKEDYPQYFK